eukprot:UN03662
MIYNTRKGQFYLTTSQAVAILTLLANEAQKNAIRLDPSLIGLIIAVVCVEGVGQSLDETVDCVAPGVSMIAHQRLVDAEKRMKKALKEKSDELAVKVQQQKQELEQAQTSFADVYDKIVNI